MSIHRLAYLLWLRNVNRGLVTRSMIIDALDFEIWKTTSDIASDLPVSSATVVYHLRNMEREEVVVRHPKGKGWKFAPIHQTELTEFLNSRKQRRKK
ncbi:MAG: ArsR family transcriptional regulator [Candidatus Thorarchaeota archaeon]|nr:MAG: ArsR family transcriptional regulator [Candidatus Thorarchaeota archaeon]